MYRNKLTKRTYIHKGKGRRERGVGGKLSKLASYIYMGSDGRLYIYDRFVEKKKDLVTKEQHLILFLAAA